MGHRLQALRGGECHPSEQTVPLTMVTGTSSGMCLHKGGCQETPTRWQLEHGAWPLSLPVDRQLLGGGQAPPSDRGLPQPTCLPSREARLFLSFPEADEEGQHVAGRVGPVPGTVLATFVPLHRRGDHGQERQGGLPRVREAPYVGAQRQNWPGFGRPPSHSPALSPRTGP